MKSKTGILYTDGTPIRDGDVIILHHNQESTNRLAKFVHHVRWSDEHAAYIGATSGDEWIDTLHGLVTDVNCVKITKKS